MDGLERIRDGIKEIMDQYFDGYTEHNGIIRAMVGPVGVTGVHAIIDTVMENGFHPEVPYAVLHFLVTLAKDIPEELEDEIKRSLHDLNRAIATGQYPAFGCFCYEPAVKQIFLDYRLPVNPTDPDAELENIAYYYGTLYDTLDLFADFIMFLCDNKGKMPSLDEYLTYLDEIADFDDYKERARLLKEQIKDLK